MNNKAFTLIELLIVIGIMIVLATVSFLSLASYRQQQTIRLASQSLTTFIRDAQAKSVSQESGLQWGVRFYTQPAGRAAYYLFTDPTTPLNTVALPGGVEYDPAMGALPKDVVFSRITGLPSPPTTIILRLTNQTAVTRTITINAQGTIQDQ